MATLCENVRRVINAKAAIRAAIIAKGVDVPEADLIDKYAGYIDQITGTAMFTFDIPDWSNELEDFYQNARGVYMDYGEKDGEGYPIYRHKDNASYYMKRVAFTTGEYRWGVYLSGFYGFTESGAPSYPFDPASQLPSSYYPLSTDGLDKYMWLSDGDSTLGTFKAYLYLDGYSAYHEDLDTSDDWFYGTMKTYTYSGGTGVTPGDGDSDLLTEIYRIINAKTDMRNVIISKGVEVPESALLDTYPDYIAQISGTGGSGSGGTGGDTGDGSGGSGGDNGDDPGDDSGDDNTTPEETIPLESIALSEEAMELTTWGDAQLQVTYTPSNTTQDGVDWSTSDLAVATVATNGKVSAKSVGGSAVITATSKENPAISASCLVDVLTDKILVKFDAEELIYTLTHDDANDSFYYAAPSGNNHLFLEYGAHISWSSADDGYKHARIWRFASCGVGTTGGLYGSYTEAFMAGAPVVDDCLGWDWYSDVTDFKEIDFEFSTVTVSPYYE